SLFLTARKREASFADQRFKPVRKALNIFCQSGNFGSGFDFGSLGLFDAESNVLGECIAEEKSLLWNVANARTQLSERIVANRNAVNKHSVFRRLNNARNETNKS